MYAHAGEPNETGEAEGNFEREHSMKRTMSPRDEDSPEVSARIHTALALVAPIVAQMKQHLVAHARKDDLGSFGNEGALAAGRTFDPDLGVPFERWATLKIRGAIIDGLRVQADLPRRLYARIRALEALNSAQEGMAHEDAGAAPPGSAAAADARIADRLAAMATAYAAGALLASDDATLESLRDSRGTPEEQLAREELRAAIRQAVAERPEPERALLERYYFGDATMAEAAGGLSRSWASRLHARAISGRARSLQKAKLVP
jgi:RNA polymerase sigma factor for flagellar operon FliA